MEKSLNGLLKWSIEQTAPSAHQPTGIKAIEEPVVPAPTATSYTVSHNANDASAPTDGGATAPSAPPRPIDPAVLNALFGGPSEADLMKAAVELITAPAEEDVPLDQKLIAFDNLEQLIESLDNANNLEPLALWSPLLSVLQHEEAELRKMAAWCVGTAVQNNVKTQERLVAMGSVGIPTLVKIVVDNEEDVGVRRKAVYALSSAVRNYQPAMDLLVEELNKHGEGVEKEGKRSVDAMDMDAVDVIIKGLREVLK